MNLRTFLGFRPPVQLPLPLWLAAAPVRPAAKPPEPAKPRTPAPASRPSPAGSAVGDARMLEVALSRQLGEPVRIEVHDNRSTMVSFRRRGDALLVRLHHMFLPPAVTLPAVLSDFVRGRGRRHVEASRWIDGWIKDHQAAIRPSAPPSLASRTGRVHDLQAIFDALNQRFFENAINAQIGWGRAPTKRRRRTIKMGVYLHDHRQIRIHPALDRADVPRYFVAFVVYHEMCHQICPPEPSQKGRARVHTATFKAREQQYPERAAALAWEKAHLGKLLRHA